jgi:hypothetical protein
MVILGCFQKRMFTVYVMDCSENALEIRKSVGYYNYF